MKTYTISFLITLYDTPISDVVQMIKSFKNSFSKFEFIFVDDFSNNKDAVNFLKENFFSHENVKILELTMNTKRVGAFIEAIKNSSGKYLHSLDSDDYVNEKNLLKVNKILERNYFDTIYFPFFLKEKNRLTIKAKEYGKPATLFSKIAHHTHKELPWSFGAMNFMVSSKIAKGIEYDFNLKGPHDDAYFAQAWLCSSKTNVVIKIPWFIYDYKIAQLKFSGPKVIMDKLSEHQKIVDAIGNYVDLKNRLTFVNYNSIVESHAFAIYTAKNNSLSVEEWFKKYEKHPIFSKIFASDYWKEMYFYKNTYKKFNLK